MRVTRSWILTICLLASLPALALDGRKITHRAEPVYPEIARRMHLTGKVEVEVTVDPKGNVTEAKLVNGNSMLGSAAVSAAKTFKYEPGEESTNRVTFDFH